METNNTLTASQVKAIESLQADEAFICGEVKLCSIPIFAGRKVYFWIEAGAVNDDGTVLARTRRFTNYSIGRRGKVVA